LRTGVLDHAVDPGLGHGFLVVRGGIERRTGCWSLSWDDVVTGAAAGRNVATGGVSVFPPEQPARRPASPATMMAKRLSRAL
jgi:hypothetical protein